MVKLGVSECNCRLLRVLISKSWRRLQVKREEHKFLKIFVVGFDDCFGFFNDNFSEEKQISSCELLKQQSYNSELMNMISIQDAKLLAMQSKIDTLKQAKKIIKSSAGFVCAKCGLFCETSNFHNHILVCDIKQKDMDIFGRSCSG